MKKRGFTLAEVLITLVIIGIIAAMTIPALMNKTNEQETVVAVKKAYSVLGQAYQRVIAENGEIYTSMLGATEQEASKTLGEMIVPYLSVLKDCGVEISGDCWSTQNGGTYRYFNGNDWFNFNQSGSHYKMILNDGTSLAVSAYAPVSVVMGDTEALKCTLGLAVIDVNGAKLPNTAGKDVFMFFITKYGIVPYGSPYVTDDVSQLSTCMTTGRGCTAWVLNKGNMDYLRKDVRW